jgi:hypothetical protein
VLWSQGVDTVLWLQLVDAPPNPSYAATYQSGLFYLNGTAKPAARAFDFPFVTNRLGHRQVRAWGRAPHGGTLAIEVRRGGRWKVLRRLPVRARQVFLATLALRGRAVLRAQVGAQLSLPWTQGA